MGSTLAPVVPPTFHPSFTNDDYVLADSTAGNLSVESSSDGPMITVGNTLPDKIASTVVLKVIGAPELLRATVR